MAYLGRLISMRSYLLSTDLSSQMTMTPTGKTGMDKMSIEDAIRSVSDFSFVSQDASVYNPVLNEFITSQIYA